MSNAKLVLGLLALAWLIWALVPLHTLPYRFGPPKPASRSSSTVRAVLSVWRIGTAGPMTPPTGLKMVTRPGDRDRSTPATGHRKDDNRSRVGRILSPFVFGLLTCHDRGNAVLVGWRRERQIRRTLKTLSQQPVVRIFQPGDVWVMERAISEDDEGVAEALRTCHLRGWVEMVQDAIPQARFETDPQSLAPTRRAPLYRLTDAGWAQIRRTHAWVIATFVVALVTLIATIAVPWLMPN
jgi:hypothetical protein